MKYYLINLLNFLPFRRVYDRVNITMRIVKSNDNIIATIVLQIHASIP